MRVRPLSCLLALLVLPALAPAQGRMDGPPGGRGGRSRLPVEGFKMADSPELAEAINAILADDGTHMRMAPRRPATPVDQFRAKQIVLTARDALGRYADVSIAEQEGYVKFMPWIESQSIFHYNNYQNVVTSLRSFDATKPVSLLYKKNAKGAMTLVGAMYSAPPDATIEELDARLPTGVAHWHEHVDFCGPKPEDVRSGKVKIDGPTTAKWLKISTREACDAAGGQFVPRLFGWMAHVYLFSGDDPKVIWGEDHGSMDMHKHTP